MESSLRGYHINYMVLDSVKLPQPFPFSLFARFSFDFLELSNLSSLQFVNNFKSKEEREYSYARSNRGASGSGGGGVGGRSSQRFTDSLIDFMAAASSSAGVSVPPPQRNSSRNLRLRRRR